jgi:predicted membrane-bound spermidine synthase
MKRERLLSKVLIVGLIGIGATLAGVSLDAFLAQQGMSDSSILYVSNVLIGILIGATAVQYKLLLKARHQILEERIGTLSEMHQHLRSIITSLAFYGTQFGAAHADVLSEHLRRVEANLVDLFTRLLFAQSVPQSVLKAVRNTGIIRSLTKSTSGANL